MSQTNCLLVSTIMLPCRLFRSTGLPLRSLVTVTPKPALHSSHKIHFYFYLDGVAPAFRSRYSTTTPNATSSSTNPDTGKETTQGTEEYTVLKQALGKIEPKLSITFTCTVEGCGERSTHQFTRHSYEKGIVLVQCPGCKNRCVCFLQRGTVRTDFHYIDISLRTTSAGSRNLQRVICVQLKTF